MKTTKGDAIAASLPAAAEVIRAAADDLAARIGVRPCACGFKGGFFAQHDDWYASPSYCG